MGSTLQVQEWGPASFHFKENASFAPCRSVASRQPACERGKGTRLPDSVATRPALLSVNTRLGGSSYNNGGVSYTGDEAGAGLCPCRAQRTPARAGLK
jgi:hypothetical protein